MTKIEQGVLILTGICLVGIAILIGIGKDASNLMPILTALVGWLLGKKNDSVVGFLKKKLKLNQ